MMVKIYEVSYNNFTLLVLSNMLNTECYIYIAKHYYTHIYDISPSTFTIRNQWNEYYFLMHIIDD